MKKLLQIDSCLGVGSTGRITESIAKLAQLHGWDCYIIHGARYVKRPSSMTDFQSVSVIGEYLHYAEGLLFDNHGLSSRIATRRIVDIIKKIQPDLIHLHCIHGYYLNYKVLFEYFQTLNVPIVWTFHDCWAFTGHCAYFDSINCKKWQFGCNKCELKKTYPTSLVFDHSKRNFELKRKLFKAIEERTIIVPVSHWLESLVKQSFLNNCRIKTIHNGTNIDVFCPSSSEKIKRELDIGSKKVVLGVALPWSERKGMPDMLRLADVLPKEEFQVVLVGLDNNQIKALPNYVKGVRRTNSAEELAEYYSLATIFVNPTYEDNFPTTNIEALACGTPVITYKTGGSPEAVSSETGWVVDQGDICSVASIIKEIAVKPDSEIKKLRTACRLRAVQLFNKDNCFEKYIELYEKLIAK